MCRALLFALLVATACTRGPAADPSAAAPPRPGVAVLTQGSAFDDAAVREQAVISVGAATGRPATSLADEPPIDRVLEPVAKRIARETPAVRGYDRHESACRSKARPIATALAARADVVYRVRLDARTSTRRATDADRDDLGGTGWSRALTTVGLGRPDTVYETKLDGWIERTTFAGTASTARAPIRTVVRALGTAAAPAALDVRRPLDAALAAMPKAAAPRWDVVARNLTSGGCPLLAHAVAETFVDDAAASRKLRAAAVVAMQKPVANRDEPVVAEAPAAAPASDVPAEPVAAEPAPKPALACSTLCGLHMVELCNHDRTLWSQHGSRWESTRCGVRRPETFLEDCYRMQWLSGTYERSCLQPCEETAEARSRLLALLQRAGCLRSGA